VEFPRRGPVVPDLRGWPRILRHSGYPTNQHLRKNRVVEARSEFAAGKSVSGEQLMADVEKWLMPMD